MNRKEAIQAYKERKIPRGAFAVRCTASGRVWVGSSPNLDAARNGMWFSLRAGSPFNHKSLQAEWNEHGESAFEFEILETLKDDVSPLALSDLLKEKKRDWATQLNAQAL
jgi:hypothetical protein